MLRSVALPVGIGFVFLLSLAVPEEAPAQRWLQTAQLEVELKNEEPGRVLLDSLTSVLARRDSLMVARRPEGEERAFSDLKERLIEEDSIGVSSASHVLIDYQFEIENRGFEESIESFQFVYRKSQGQTKIPLLYVNGQASWVRALLKTPSHAFPTGGSCVPPKTFSMVLPFPQMYRDGKITKISGNDVRDGFERKKRKVAKKIQRLYYMSM